MLLDVTFRMVYLKCASKHVSWALSFNIVYKIHLFLRKNFGGTRQPRKKMNPPSIILGGGER